MRSIYDVIEEALVERGWKTDSSGMVTKYIDPEGNEWSGVEVAVTAQYMREVAHAADANVQRSA